MIVKGYLEGKVEGVDMEEQNLMDNVDYYYHHCRSIMDSVPAVWEYEELVLRPLYEAIAQSDIDQLTPIHWHIATMVIEEERKGRGRKVSRNYAASMAGPKGSPAIQKAPTNYHDMYSNYEYPILNPSPNGEPCLYDYYRLRGFIAREPNLFTNDRERLLRMLAVRFAPWLVPMDSNSAPRWVPPTFARSGHHPTWTRWQSGSDHLPTCRRGSMAPTEQIYWHTYDDAQGAWGSLIGLGQAATYDLGMSNSRSASVPELSMAAANQSLRVTGRYRQTANLNQSISRYDISRTLNQFAKNFRNAVGQGMNLGDDFPNSVTATPISFDDWIKRAQAFLISKISDPTATAIDDMWACFELNHAPVVTPQMGLRGVKGDHKLRLWLDPAWYQSVSASAVT